MSRFLFWIVILIFAVCAGLLIAEDPGMVLLTYQHWMIKMPLWFAFAAFFAMLFVIYFLQKLFMGFSNFIFRCKNWWRWRKKTKSYTKTNLGLLELVAGNWYSAEKNLISAIDQSELPLINYLAAAKAAHEQKAYDKRDVYLREALLLDPEHDLAIGLTRAKLFREQGKVNQAISTLTLLQQKYPKHPIVLHLLQKCYVEVKNWQALIKLFPVLYKSRALSAEALHSLEKLVYQSLLTQKNATFADLQDAWQSIPGRLQFDPDLLYSYLEQLVMYPNTASQAEEYIARFLRKHWHEGLAKLYGLQIGEKPQKQLAKAERWLKWYPDQSILFLTLGRLCMHCQLWGKAKIYLEKSLQLKSTPEACYEMGKLDDQLGDMVSAMENYKKGCIISAH